MKPVCAKPAPGERTKNLTRIIDAGGIGQFYTGYKDQSPVMLLSYTLKETVVPEKLQRALEKAIEHFPVFRVRLALNENRQPVYEKNELLPCIYENDGKTHTFGKASRGYLFRVSYHSRRISLSIHHMLTDFFGANEFLKYILRCYLHQLDESIGTSKDTIAVDPTDFRDPYDLYGNADAVGYYMADKWKNELLIPNRMNYSRGVPQQIHMASCAAHLGELPKTDAVRFYLCPERRISFDGFVNYEGRRFGVPYSYPGATARITRNGDTLYIYSSDLRFLLVTHNVTWSRKDSFCEGQYEELSQPEELPTMPVKTQILQLPKPPSDLSFAKFDFDEEGSV